MDKHEGQALGLANIVAHLFACILLFVLWLVLCGVVALITSAFTHNPWIIGSVTLILPPLMILNAS